jgi:hypothetical protein
LFDELEARVRDLAAAWGGMDPHTPRWQDLLADLVQKGVMPAGVASNVTLLDQIRNAVVHGDGQIRKGEAFTAIDAGLDVLTALDGIPVQGYEVVRTGVPLYRDPDLTIPWRDSTGVIVRQHKPHGRKGKPQGPYPTHMDYEEGQIVGWQWSFGEPVREYFWKSENDERAGLIRSAWFIGEPLRRPRQ